MKGTSILVLAAVVTLATAGCAGATAPAEDGAHRPAAAGAPGGEAPAGSEAGEAMAYNGYGYTVKEYLEYAIQDLDQVWTPWFLARGGREPRVAYRIVFEGETFTSRCTDKSGAHLQVTSDHENAYYCSGDSMTVGGQTYEGMIILPAVTFQRMWSGRMFGKQGERIGDNDFAAAFIVAHEFGHHVQDEISQQFTMPPFTGANKELIADCYAGIWINAKARSGQLDTTDWAEAINAATMVGAAHAGGTHGTAPQRVRAVEIGASTGYAGYAAGDPDACNAAYWR